MKKIFIFFILFLTINSFSIYNTRNVIEGLFPEFKFGEECISKQIDRIVIDLYNNCANYYYELVPAMKTRYLMLVLINIAEIRAEISNCGDKIFTAFTYIIGNITDLKEMNYTFFENNWTIISEFINDLFKIYHSKNFNYTEFGMGLSKFIFNLNSTPY